MIYLDSAAVVKLIRREPETLALTNWLNSHSGVPLFSSSLVEVEVPRALRRAAPLALTGVPAVLAHVNRVEIDATIRATAAAYAEPTLRSLDAIHLATAQVLAYESGITLDAFVTYDKRLLMAATTAGFHTESPGA